MIEVGLRGHTNRWAHMLQARFIRLSGLHSEEAHRDTLTLTVCLSVCVCVIALYRTGEEQICLISFSITYISNSIRPQLPEFHPLSHTSPTPHKPLKSAQNCSLSTWYSPATRTHILLKGFVSTSCYDYD